MCVCVCVCGTGFDRDLNGFGVKGLPGFTCSNVCLCLRGWLPKVVLHQLHRMFFLLCFASSQAHVRTTVKHAGC